MSDSLFSTKTKSPINYDNYGGIYEFIIYAFYKHGILNILDYINSYNNEHVRYFYTGEIDHYIIDNFDFYFNTCILWPMSKFIHYEYGCIWLMCQTPHDDYVQSIMCLDKPTICVISYIIEQFMDFIIKDLNIEAIIHKHNIHYEDKCRNDIVKYINNHKDIQIEKGLTGYMKILQLNNCSFVEDEHGNIYVNDILVDDKFTVYDLCQTINKKN